MEKIDWDYWLKRKSLFEIQMVLLTLGFDPDPEIHKIDYLDGHYLVDKSALKGMQKDYLRRMTFIKDFRFTPYEYMADDGEWGNYFSANNGKVLVKRFLLWLKNEDMGWTLPPELQAHIDGLGMSIKNSQKRLKPKEWNPLAEQYAIEILKADSNASLDETASLVAERFEKEEILSVRSDLIKWETIKRYLSKWGFSLEKIKANKK